MKKVVFTLLISLMLVMVLTASVFAAPTSQEVAPVIEVTPIFLGSIAGTALSLFFSFTPGLNIKYAALPPETKRLIMLALLAAVSLTLFILGCEGILATGLACNRAGVIELLTLFFSALMLNTSTYTIVPLPAKVKMAALIAKEKSLRDAAQYGG